MEKVVEFIEKHVQWLALGLGVLWLGWMGWKYVITPPAAVEIAGERLTAGRVDKKTVEKAVTPLQAEMNRSEAPEMPVENFAAGFQSTMNYDGKEPVMLATTLWPRNEPIKIDVPRLPGTPEPGPGGDVGPPRVALLPANPPPAVPADVVVGRSTIVPPVIAGQPAVAPPAGQVAAPAQPVLNQNVDKDWVTQSFKIPVHEIGKQFVAAKIMPGAPFATTVFLQVELIRQEQSPDGAWANETVIKPLENGMQRVPYPAPNAGRNLEHTYLNWAVANQGDILEPAFYQVAQGDPWRRPGVAAVQQAVFNPANFPPGTDISGLPPDQREQVLQYRREQHKLKQQQPAQPRTPRAPRAPRGPTGPEEGMEGMFSPRDPDREAYAQVRRPPVRQQVPPEFMDPALMEDMTMMEGEMGMGAQPAVPVAGVAGVDFPTGEFEPAKWAKPEIEAWAHDDTVVPGKTYRYKMRYRIKNPLYATGNAAKNPNDAKVFALTSADSAWGTSVTVPEIANFFIAAGRIGGAAKMRFDIFRFHNGLQERQSGEFGPGDRIGRPERDIDFATRWTIVDFRRDARDQDNVILVDDDGHTIIRNLSMDRNNPLYKKLQEEVNAQEATAALQPNGR